MDGLRSVRSPKRLQLLLILKGDTKLLMSSGDMGSTVYINVSGALVTLRGHLKSAEFFLQYVCNLKEKKYIRYIQLSTLLYSVL